MMVGTTTEHRAEDGMWWQDLLWGAWNGITAWVVLVAVFLFVGFTAARMITHDAFEGRPAKLTILNSTHELVTILVMAVIIGLLPA